MFYFWSRTLISVQWNLTWMTIHCVNKMWYFKTGILKRVIDSFSLTSMLHPKFVGWTPTFYMRIPQKSAVLLITIWRFEYHHYSLSIPFLKELVPLFLLWYFIKSLYMQLFLHFIMGFILHFPYDDMIQILAGLFLENFLGQ